MSYVRDFPRGIQAKLGNVSNKGDLFDSATSHAESVSKYLAAFGAFSPEDKSVGAVAVNNFVFFFVHFILPRNVRCLVLVLLTLTVK